MCWSLNCEKDDENIATSVGTKIFFVDGVIERNDCQSKFLKH